MGILTAAERDELVAALGRIQYEESADDEDIHTFVIRKLKEQVRDLADKIHTGRSRNEQVSLDTRLWLRDEIDATKYRLRAVMSALVKNARANKDAVIPGYTHLRRAQAVLWPHYLLAYFEMFARDAERFADARRLYSSEEFGCLELSDGVTSGSSLMPQKKNPDSLELLRGKSGRVFGSLTSLFVTMKGLPMTYNRDMQEDKEPLFESADQLSMSLDMIRVVIETTSLKPEPPARAADESWVVATDLAEALARAGTPFHRAHQIAGKLVLESVKAGKTPGDWTAEELVKFAPEFRPEMAELLRPEAGMKSRELETVARALDEAEARLAHMTDE